MFTSILSAAAPVVIAIISRLLSRKDIKEERKRRYLSYIEYWEKHRVTPVTHGDDISEHLKDEAK